MKEELKLKEEPKPNEGPKPKEKPKLKEPRKIHAAKVDRENNLSDIWANCQPSWKFTKAVLHIQQPYKKFSGHTNYLSKLGRFVGRVQFRNSLHSIRGVAANRWPTKDNHKY